MTSQLNEYPYVNVGHSLESVFNVVLYDYTMYTGTLWNKWLILTNEYLLSSIHCLKDKINKIFIKIDWRWRLSLRN